MDVIFFRLEWHDLTPPESIASWNSDMVQMLFLRLFNMSGKTTSAIPLFRPPPSRNDFKTNTKRTSPVSTDVSISTSASINLEGGFERESVGVVAWAPRRERTASGVRPPGWATMEDRGPSEHHSWRVLRSGYRERSAGSCEEIFVGRGAAGAEGLGPEFGGNLRLLSKRKYNMRMRRENLDLPGREKNPVSTRRGVSQRTVYLRALAGCTRSTAKNTTLLSPVIHVTLADSTPDLGLGLSKAPDQSHSSQRKVRRLVSLVRSSMHPRNHPCGSSRRHSLEDLGGCGKYPQHCKCICGLLESGCARLIVGYPKPQPSGEGFPIRHAHGKTPPASFSTTTTATGPTRSLSKPSPRTNSPPPFSTLSATPRPENMPSRASFPGN